RLQPLDPVPAPNTQICMSQALIGINPISAPNECGYSRMSSAHVGFPSQRFGETLAQAEAFDVGWETMLVPTASLANWV
ncbi:MAG TPA: hypothetical protein VFN11_03965, partial [Ktedonobacterales bacterium]|nr:hypothetical protein [Ktedonobacterales bacterium]